MHGALEALYRERPGGDPVPRPGSLDAWLERGAELARGAGGASWGSPGESPAERAIRRRIELLLAAFLRREAARDPVLLSPQLLEATFGNAAGDEKPALDLGGWLLHGRSTGSTSTPAGRPGLVHDYKVRAR